MFAYQDAVARLEGQVLVWFPSIVIQSHHPLHRRLGHLWMCGEWLCRYQYKVQEQFLFIVNLMTWRLCCITTMVSIMFLLKTSTSYLNRFGSFRLGNGRSQHACGRSERSLLRGEKNKNNRHYFKTKIWTSQLEWVSVCPHDATWWCCPNGLCLLLTRSLRQIFNDFHKVQRKDSSGGADLSLSPFLAHVRLQLDHIALREWQLVALLPLKVKPCDAPRTTSKQWCQTSDFLVLVFECKYGPNVF